LQGLDKLVGSIADELFSAFLFASFTAAQFILAKALLANYIYFSLAWHLAVYFLPIAIMLAYFRGLSQFMLGICKHLVSMTIAIAVMASLANTLLDTRFWITPEGGGAPGLISATFGNAIIAEGDKWYFNWFTAITSSYARNVSLMQSIFILGMIGVLLNNIYEVVRGVIDGSMHTAYASEAKAGYKAAMGAK
jgi:hypothetical protein